MKLLIPILGLLVGLGGGVGAGLFLAPPPQEAEPEKSAMADKEPKKAKPDEGAERDYIKMSNQFVIPVLRGERVISMVVLSLSLEVASGKGEKVFAQEPKLRDAFLQVLFDHANIGGFDGAFTRAGNLETLRTALFETARSILKDAVSDVLITDIGRQDV